MPALRRDSRCDALTCGCVLAATVFLIALPRPAAAQESDTTRTGREAGETAEEALLEGVEDEAAGESLAEDVEALRLSPLDVNAASAADLAAVPGLSLLLAERIVAHRARRGAFRSLPELTSVEGVTEAVYAAARPFLRLGAAPGPAARRASPYPAWPSWTDLRRDLRLDALQRVGWRLGTTVGDTSGAYVGGPMRTTTRLRLKSRRRLDASLLLDTDAGERAAFQPSQGRIGSDFASAGLLVRDVGRIEAAVVGDFAVRFGQGLVAWRAGSLGKSREATRGVARAGDGLALHASAEETRFLRGAGLSVRLTPALTATVFASRRRLDATPSDDSTAATGIGTSGLHRTASEIARRAWLGETHGGLALRLRRSAVDGGVLATATRTDAPLAPPDDPARRFAARGDAFSAVSAFAHGRLGRALVFGEAAGSQNGSRRNNTDSTSQRGASQRGMAAVAGVALPLGGGSEAVVAARAFGRAFVSRFGDAFSERSGTPQNERGLYAGLRLAATRTLTATAYLDAYRFPWLRTTAPRPSGGLDALVSTEFRPRRWLALLAQARHETREEGAVVLDALGRERATTLPETRQSARLHGEYVFSRALVLRARVEAVRFRRAGEAARTGSILYHDVRLTPRRRLLGATVTLDARLALFATDGFDARVYAYESDVRYGFSVPALSGRGTRATVLARASRGRLSAEARYAVTRYEDVTEVGSGLDTVAGPRARDVRVQFGVRL